LLCSPDRDFITIEGFQEAGLGKQFRISVYRIIDGVDTLIGAAQGEGVNAGGVLGEVSLLRMLKIKDRLLPL
jgi:hypothetical protein